MRKMTSMMALFLGPMLFFVWNASAGMSSDNYKIRSMVLSCGGGTMGSLNYLSDSTMGQPTPLCENEVPSSTNYVLHPGFQYTLGGEGLYPVINDIQFDECLSELCDTDVCVDAYDPQGGTLSYDWVPENGGEILGYGECVVFDPPDSGPHPCPYQVTVTVTSDTTGLPTSETVDIHVKLAGDADGSGRVDILDKRLVRDAYGAEPGDSNWDPLADVNCSGRVDILDKRVVRDQYGVAGCSCPIE